MMAKVTEPRRYPLEGFQRFVLNLSDGRQVSGISALPAKAHSDGYKTPLLVLLHGGRCHAEYYNLDEEHSIAPMAGAFNIPVVAIDRPCYGQTSTILPVPDGSTFHQVTGRALDGDILPHLWRAFGPPNGCTAMVVGAHSLGVPGLIVAAGRHRADLDSSDNAQYPLAGIILSGWGTRQHQAAVRQRLSWSEAEIHQNRRLMMLGDPALGAADPAVGQDLRSQTVPSPREEAAELGDGTWAECWATYAEGIRVPVLYGIGEHDWLWQGTTEHVKEFGAFFTSSSGFEGSVVPGAPHAIEWSYSSRAWVAKCLAFALDVVAL